MPCKRSLSGVTYRCKGNLVGLDEENYDEKQAARVSYLPRRLEKLGSGPSFHVARTRLLVVTIGRIHRYKDTKSHILLRLFRND